MDKEEKHPHGDADLPYFHLTPGNVTDHSHLRQTISGHYVQDGVVRHDSSCITDQYQVASISFDRWNSSTLVTQLTEMGCSWLPLAWAMPANQLHCESWSSRSWRSS